jgi:bleomycin hydrolase
MAIVGLARDAQQNRYFVLKNSWGDNDADHGLIYMTYQRFREETLAVEMTKEAYTTKPFVRF